jgi:hypothetical protein
VRMHHVASCKHVLILPCLPHRSGVKET